MEKLLQEFYTDNKRLIWFSESAQIRKFSQWAAEHGYKEQLEFVETKRNRVINIICIGLLISVAVAIAFGWQDYAMNFFPIGLILIIFLPMFSKRIPTLTRAEQADDGLRDN